jgi:hypothetical protein
MLQMQMYEMELFMFIKHESRHDKCQKTLRSKAQIRHFVDRHLGFVSERGDVFFYVRAVTLYTGALASLAHW